MEKSNEDERNTKIWIDHPKLGIICLERKCDKDRREKLEEELVKDWDKLLAEKDEEIARRLGDGGNEEEIKAEGIEFKKKAEKYKELQLEEKIAEERDREFEDYELLDEFEEIKKRDYVVYKKKGVNIVGQVIEINELKTLKVLVDMEYKLLRTLLTSKVFFLQCVVYLKDRVLEKEIEVDINTPMETLLSYEVNNALQDIFSISNFIFCDGLRIVLVPQIEDTNDKEEIIKKYKKKKIDKNFMDLKTHYKEDKDKGVIYIDKNSTLAKIPQLHNNPLEILLITPEDLRAVQLYDTVKYGPAISLSCSIYPSKSLYVHGIGIYGPYPNTKGTESFRFLLEIENMKTGENSKNALCIENEEPAVWKLFFNKPVFVKADESFRIKCNPVHSKGLVYALKSKDGVVFGDDGVRFTVANFEDHFIASVYYSCSCDF